MVDAHIIRPSFGSRPLLVDTHDRPKDKTRLLTPTERAFHDAFGHALAGMNALETTGELAVDPTTDNAARESRRLRSIAFAQEAIDGLRTIVGLLAGHHTPTEAA